MKIVDKGLERKAALEKIMDKRRELWATARAAEEERHKKTTFAVSGATMRRFLDAFHVGAMRQVYPDLGHPMFGFQETETANKFLALAIRDRKKLETLIINDDMPEGGPRDRHLALPTDPQLIDELTREAAKVGIGYEAYLGALFGSTVHAILETHRARTKEAERRVREATPLYVEGWMPADVKRRLEKKYGPPKFNPVFGVTVDTYLDMLCNLAKEVLPE